MKKRKGKQKGEKRDMENYLHVMVWKGLKPGWNPV